MEEVPNVRTTGDGAAGQQKKKVLLDQEVKERKYGVVNDALSILKG